MQTGSRFLFLFLPLFGALGCGASLDDTRSGSSDLYGNTAFLWSGSPAMIPVCWENAGSGVIDAASFSVPEATARTWVREAVEGQWSRYGRVNFTQWDEDCVSGEAGVHIQILATGQSSAPGGSTLDGVNNGVKLNLYYDDRIWDCQLSEANLKRCVQAVALHEFGHVLGFYHEEERPDYAGGTGACADQDFPNSNPQYYGAYDLDSVMSYCGQPGGDISTWKTEISPGDIAAVQKAYGRRVSGQFATARGADMLANRIDPNGSFIWDADEAAGQKWRYDFANRAFIVEADGATACLDTWPGAVDGRQLTASTCVHDSFQRFPLDNLALRGFGGLCLDVPGGNTANGTGLQVWKCGAFAASNQRFSIDTSRRIRFGTTNKCVTWSNTIGSSLFLWDCGGAPFAAQQSFTFNAGGTLRFGPTGQTQRCADVESWTTEEYLDGVGVPRNGLRVQTYTCDTDQLNQRWNLSGVFKHEGGKCVDVAFASNNNAAVVQAFGCNGTIAQEWDYYWK
jgi:hypothetical protein